MTLTLATCWLCLEAETEWTEVDQLGTELAMGILTWTWRERNISPAQSAKVSAFFRCMLLRREMRIAERVCCLDLDAWAESLLPKCCVVNEARTCLLLGVILDRLQHLNRTCSLGRFICNALLFEVVRIATEQGCSSTATFHQLRL